MASKSLTPSPSSSGQDQRWDPGTWKDTVGWKDAVGWNTDYIYSRAAQLGLLRQPKRRTNGRQQANDIVQHNQGCNHCPLDAEVDPKRKFNNKLSENWLCDLKHDVRQAVDAAASGCPFFVWLCDQLIISSTPVEQLERTKISVEFKTRKNDLFDVYWATVQLWTERHSWSPSGFAVFSTHG